jgi:hypothetical protein
MRELVALTSGATVSVQLPAAPNPSHGVRPMAQADNSNTTNLNPCDVVARLHALAVAAEVGACSLERKRVSALACDSRDRPAAQAY